MQFPHLVLGPVTCGLKTENTVLEVNPCNWLMLM